MTRAIRLPALALAAALLLSPAAAPAVVFEVTTTDDTADGTCDDHCSLREAIVAANATDTKDTITVPAGLYELTLGGRLRVEKPVGSVTVEGAGVAATVVDGLDATRVLHVAGTGTVAIFRHLTLTRGLVRPSVGAGEGGGVYVEAGARLSLVDGAVTDSVAERRAPFSNGLADGRGGGVWNAGSFRAVRSTIAGNTARGVAVDPFSSVTEALGGGIYNNGSLELTDTTVAANTAEVSPGDDSMVAYGGGVFSAPAAVAEITRSTISGNRASGPAGTDASGGGLHAEGFVALDSSTVSGNFATSIGGGVSFLGANVALSTGTIIAGKVSDEVKGGTAAPIAVSRRTIIAGNSIGEASAGFDDCGVRGEFEVVSEGYNLAGTSCPLDQPDDLLGMDPLLQPLADNGGPTPTHALSPGSPALDHIPLDVCDDQPLVDQRGEPRPGPDTLDPEGRCDVGAYELVALVELAVTKTAPASAAPGEHFAYLIEVRNPGDATAPDVVLTDALPAELTLIDVVGPSCTFTSQAPTVVECDFGDLAPGDSAAVTLEVSADTAGSVTNTATATEAGGVSASDSATTEIAEEPVELAVTMTAPASAAPGEAFVYLIEVSNSGGVTAPDVVLSDPLPTGLNLIDLAGNGCGVFFPGPVLECDFGDLAPGASETVTVEVSAGTADSVTNTATATESGGVSASGSATTEVVEPETPLFADGFEGGDTAAWSSVVGGS